MATDGSKYAVPPLDTVDRSVTEARSFSELAYLLIRDKIVTVQLMPSTLIDEHVLSEQLGLGRTPIREALVLLANEHLVTALPRRGRVVSEINIADLRRIYEARHSCEVPAVRFAAERATAAEKQYALGCIEELRTLDAAGFDERALIRLDLRSHAHVYRCVHNPYFEETLMRYLLLALRLWYFHMDSLVEVKAREADHPGVVELEKLLQAIVDGDADAAAEVALAHIRRSQEEILSPLRPAAAVAAA